MKSLKKIAILSAAIMAVSSVPAFAAELTGAPAKDLERAAYVTQNGVTYYCDYSGHVANCDGYNCGYTTASGSYYYGHRGGRHHGGGHCR